jgi:hypothetical protein
MAISLIGASDDFARFGFSVAAAQAVHELDADKSEQGRSDRDGQGPNDMDLHV